MGDLRLRWKTERISFGRPGSMLDDLLELVDDQRHAAPARRRPARPAARAVARASRRCRRGARPSSNEKATSRPGVDGDRRLRPAGRETAPGPARARARAARRCSRRSSAASRSASLSLSASSSGRPRRRAPAPSASSLTRAPDQRGLSVAARGEDHDVLAVADVGDQLGELAVAVGERLIERQRAEAKRVASVAP